MTTQVKSILSLHTSAMYRVSPENLIKAIVTIRARQDGYETRKAWLKMMLEADYDGEQMTTIEVASQLLHNGEMFLIGFDNKQVNLRVEEEVFEALVEYLNELEEKIKATAIN